MAEAPSSWKKATNVITPVFWPLAAPILSVSDGVGRTWWRAVCIACVVPITAILHNRVFWVGSCMLNPFGSDYTPAVTYAWLLRDPSLPWAIALAGFAWIIGKNHFSFRVLVAPVFSSFLPLSVWLWDIPFSGRIICRHLHDSRVLLADEMYLSTRDFYFLGCIFYLMFVAMIIRKTRRDRIKLAPHPLAQE